MRGKAVRAVALGVFLLASRAAFAADEAKDAAANFYRSYARLRAGGLTGIPDGPRLAQLAPLLTPELHDLFSVALLEQKRCEDKFPDDKPPWIEGDIFSSSFEGFTSFRAAASRPAKQGRRVTVNFIYTEGKDRVKWTDTLLLRNEGGRWLVDDVFYRAHFPFGSGFGSNLRSSLKSIPAC
ncbi:MAG TPA: hypothetical protein VIF38_12650 [Burkholderiales bacterium]|jgi:hypothetical protein